MIRTLLASALLVACGLAPAARAETVDCMQITALPATLTSQGVYCLKHDVASAISTGAAITVAANNVTVDCNGYKVGGLAAGAGTNATGIHAASRLNTVVRNCNVRGFSIGINLQGGAHTIEDNRLDGNTRVGILASGDGSLVRRNRVFDTGNAISQFIPPVGILAAYSVDVLDNTVSGVSSPAGTNQLAVGIYTSDNPDGLIAGNRVRTVIADGTGEAYGIRNLASGTIVVRDNQLVGMGAGTGVFCPDSGTQVEDNVLLGWSVARSVACNDEGNLTD